MRLAVLSDIHSNDIALSVCIEDIEKNSIKGIILLGDYISDCPDPQKTLHLLKELTNRFDTWFIKGNREQYFIDHSLGKMDGWKYSSYKGSLLYTYENISPQDIVMLNEYPDTRIIEIQGTSPILTVHGSPDSLRELMYAGDDNTKRYMEYMPVEYMLCGHTHEQFMFEHKGKVLINPGSVGVAIGVRASAHYGIIEWTGERWEYEFKTIPYDFKKLHRRFMDSDLMIKGGVWPKCILHSIASGINYGPLCAKAAFDMAQNDGKNVDRDGIPEEYWIRAARKLKIFQEISCY